MTELYRLRLGGASPKDVSPVERAMQCTFDLCARTFSNPSYENFSSTLSPESQTVLNHGSTLSPAISSGPVLLNMTPADADHLPMNTTFMVNAYDHTDITNILRNYFRSTTVTKAHQSPLISLPIALVVLTFIMLVVVILRNSARGVPIWKSLSLALLFHTLEGWDKPDGSNQLSGRGGAGRADDCTRCQ
ncbi:hypothetical protein F4818DRAFT_443797 [Hypoxylon cercidicola]|nr:hypothetical protein F4818DRAFT_443797 [Hypoxylon cercidicola]